MATKTTEEENSSESLMIVEENLGFSSPTEEQCSFIWTIKRFSLCGKEEENKCIYSPDFCAKNGRIVWCVVLEPFNHKWGEEGRCIGFFLQLERPDTTIHVSLSLSLKDSENGDVKKTGCKAGTLNSEESAFGTKDMIDRDVLLKHLKDDILKIQVNIIARFVFTPKSLNSPITKLGKHMLSLYEEKKFSDFVICVEGRDIPVHTPILAARSPVFEAMFQSSMVEGASRRAKIEDFEFRVIDALLNYMYTDEPPILRLPMAKDILAAADKYAVDDLKEICCDYLMENLNTSNVLDFLLLADSHSATEFKCKCIEFLLCHRTSISIEDYKTVLEDRGSLLYDILLAVMKL